MNQNGPQMIEYVTDAQLARIVSSAFGEGAAIAHCEPTVGGQFNTGYRVRIENPVEEFILRIAPRHTKPLFAYERTMMPAEPRICAMIRESGVPVPEIIVSDNSRTAIDRDFNCVRYLDAVPLNHPSVPGAARPDLMRQVGVYTAMIHSVTSDRFGWPLADGSVNGGTEWAGVFGGLLGETCERSRDAGVIGEDEAARLMEVYADASPAFEQVTTPTLVHNDIWPPNILVRPHEGRREVAAIIDADRAMFADREMEFIVWEADPDFMAGYGIPLDESPEAVLRRKFYVLYLTMFCAWAYTVQIHRPEVLPRIVEDTRSQVGALIGNRP